VETANQMLDTYHRCVVQDTITVASDGMPKLSEWLSAEMIHLSVPFCDTADHHRLSSPPCSDQGLCVCVCACARVCVAGVGQVQATG
jgi:hypothetical protein